MERDAAITQFALYLQRRFPERRTVVDYCSDVRQFAATCVKPWRDVTMHDIDDFVDRQRQSGLKPATINRRVAALKTFFDFLAEDSGELRWPNPVRFKRHAGKRGRQLPRDLSDATVEQLWQAITAPRDRAWFVLMCAAVCVSAKWWRCRSRICSVPPRVISRPGCVCVARGGRNASFC